MHKHIIKTYHTSFMNNFMLNLITYSACIMDRELENQLPTVFNIDNWHTPFDGAANKLDEIAIDIERQSERHKDSMFSEDPFQDQQISTTETISSMVDRQKEYLCFLSQQIQNQHKKSKQKEQGAHSMISSSQRDTQNRYQVQLKSKGYPTKNFLPNFKGPHFAYLDRFLSQQEVNSIEFVEELRLKNGISLSDYEALYKVRKFKNVFKRMFANKFLFRELLLSRSTLQFKKVYHKKLHVFESAFNQMKFLRIN